MKHKLCENCLSPIVHKNGNALYCDRCSHLIKEYKAVLRFIEKNYTKIHTDKRLKLVYLILRKDLSS